MPHQSAIYKALFGIWVFFSFFLFLHVRSENDTQPPSDFGSVLYLSM